MDIIPDDSGIKVDIDGVIWLTYDYQVFPTDDGYHVVYSPNLGRDGLKESVGEADNIHDAIAMANLYDANLMSTIRFVPEYFVGYSLNMEPPEEQICSFDYADALHTFYEMADRCEDDGMSILTEQRLGHAHQITLAGNGNRGTLMLVVGYSPAKQEV